MSDDRDPGSASRQPEFGPGGYLPERASKRARKIVLRAPMGVHWIIGAVVAGAVIVGAGLLWLAQSDDPPGQPWVAVGPLEQLGDATVHEALDVLIVATGRPRAFLGVEVLGLRWCEGPEQIEGFDGRVWTPTGRAQTVGTESLEQHPTRVHDGILYVDPTVTAPGPEPVDPDTEPACQE
jgi:hypothetical protein